MSDGVQASELELGDVGIEGRLVQLDTQMLNYCRGFRFVMIKIHRLIEIAVCHFKSILVHIRPHGCKYELGEEGDIALWQIEKVIEIYSIQGVLVFL